MAANTALVFACKSMTFSGDEVDGVSHGRIGLRPVSRRDALGHETVVTDNNEVVVEVYGNNPRALALLLDEDADDVVFNVLRDDNSAGTETLADVHFVESIGAAELPAIDEGGKLPVAGVRGYVEGTGNLAAKWISA